MIRPNAKAQAIIDSIDYMAIATVSEEGQPWNTPVAGYRDDDFNFYWASWTENQHSKNIRSNSKVFIVFYDSTPSTGPSDGIYIQAEAQELINENEVMQAALVFGDDPYNPSDGNEYLGNKPRRIYKAVPKSIWTNCDSEINGNFVDKRTGAEA